MSACAFAPAKPAKKSRELSVDAERPGPHQARSRSLTRTSTTFSMIEREFRRNGTFRDDDGHGVARERRPRSIAGSTGNGCDGVDRVRLSCPTLQGHRRRAAQSGAVADERRPGISSTLAFVHSLAMRFHVVEAALATERHDVELTLCPRGAAVACRCSRRTVAVRDRGAEPIVPPPPRASAPIAARDLHATCSGAPAKLAVLTPGTRSFTLLA